MRRFGSSAGWGHRLMAKRFHSLLGFIIALLLIQAFFADADSQQWIAASVVLMFVLVFVKYLPREKSKKKPGKFIIKGTGLTRTDLEQAVTKLLTTAREIKKLARSPNLDPELREGLSRQGRLIGKIAINHLKDPRDLPVTHLLVDHHLDKMELVVRGYVSLTKQARSEASTQRLEAIRAKIMGFEPYFEHILEACLENDFQQLEVSTKTLGQMMDIELPLALPKEQ